MSRAERRRTHRAVKKAAKKADGDLLGKVREEFIHLTNPVSQHFPAFVFGNATQCDRVVQAGTGKGKRLVLCGAGPSLAEDAADWCGKGDEVWGCNSAAIWLLDNGHPCTHGFTVDQTPQMLTEWATTPYLTYLLASSCHPHLVELLLANGREIEFFHNYVGIKGTPVEVPESEGGGAISYEDWMYSALYPATCRLGSGLNSVTRAMDLAVYRDFDEVVILGADCAIRLTAPRPPDAMEGSKEEREWLEHHSIMHADGGHALASGATHITFGGEIDGRHWETKPDLIISAVWMVKMAQADSRFRIIGDTLPNALRDKDDDFLNRLPTLTDAKGSPLQYEKGVALSAPKD